MVIIEPEGMKLHDQLKKDEKKQPSYDILKATVTQNEYKKIQKIENFPSKIRERLENIEDNPLPPKTKLSEQIVVSLSNRSMQKLNELVKISQIPKSKFLRYAMLYYLNDEKMKPQYLSNIVIGLTEDEKQEIQSNIKNSRRYVENIIDDIDQDAIEYIEDHANIIYYNFYVNNEQKRKIRQQKISPTQLVQQTIQSQEDNRGLSNTTRG